MSSIRWRMAAALQICLLLTAGTAYATDSSNSAIRSAPLRSAPLNLRVPPLDKVMARGDLLAEVGSGDDPIGVVGEPPLLPMASDGNAPLGFVDSLRWLADHPTQ